MSAVQQVYWNGLMWTFFCVQKLRRRSCKPGSVFQLEKGLQESRMEIEAMQNEKLQYEENMRQAFLRGLSALNQEAHTIFQTPRSTQVTMVPTSVPSLSYAHSALNSSMTLPQSTTANQAGMASTQLFRSAEHTPLGE